MRFIGRLQPLAQDGLLAAGMAVLLSAILLYTPDAGAPDFAGVLAGSLALVAWRRAPLVALFASAACMLAVAAHLQPGPAVAYPVMVAVFAAVWAGHQLVAAVASLVFLGTGFAVNLPGAEGAGQNFQSTSLLVGWFVAAGAAATVTRHRQAYLEEAERRAAEAERTREEAALRRAGEERLRIARELHDSLTHSISIIKVQAGVAVHLAHRRGEDVPPALVAIQEASGDAMRELRATLEVLRDHDRSEGETAASGLDRLDDLVERARSTGLPVTVTVTGTPRELPPEVDRAAYRIVQEALTNVSRHAGGAAAEVVIDYRQEDLVVRVDDHGEADPDAPPVPGTGLLGMRERVTALGGRLRAEPRPESGFTVRAELPLGGPA
ncbi:MULTISPECIES: sensor histidine kinase [Actinomadura]|uniref:histidine kinase n=1 Tax=Actinomadura madurae TaxID=1993 RepID=A0A1I5KJA7_9ACTN|nr:sensor histidine kinase [Actinomadura madurae]SFO84967.1 Histidine kinase [Actinomadura madurae]SPT49985.1 Sensor histidine kinase desK [Actinomadura madurae]